MSLCCFLLNYSSTSGLGTWSKFHKHVCLQCSVECGSCCVRLWHTHTQSDRAELRQISLADDTVKYSQWSMRRQCTAQSTCIVWCQHALWMLRQVTTQITCIVWCQHALRMLRQVTTQITCIVWCHHALWMLRQVTTQITCIVWCQHALWMLLQVTTHLENTILGQLSLASLQGRYIEYQLQLG